MAIDKNAKGINLDLYFMMVKLACIVIKIYSQSKKKLHQKDGVSKSYLLKLELL